MGLSNVPVEKIDEIEPTFYKVIREILKTGQEDLISRIRVISKSKYVSLASQLVRKM